MTKKHQKDSHYTVLIRSKDQKNLLRIPIVWQEKIKKALIILEFNPFYGQKLWGQLKNYRKIIVWPYRIVYEVSENKKEVRVKSIGHRKDIYKKL